MRSTSRTRPRRRTTSPTRSTSEERPGTSSRPGASRRARPGQGSSSWARTRTGGMSPSDCSTAAATRCRSASSRPSSAASSPRSSALSAGYFRGFVDGILSRTMDLIWAFPVILLGIALGTALAVGGLDFGLFTVSGALAVDSGDHHRRRLCPIHGQAPARAGPESAREGVRRGGPLTGGGERCGSCFGRSSPTSPRAIIVFIPLMIANAILLEAALSFLGAGVQPPNPSWGTMISDGIRLIPSAMHLTLDPGRHAGPRRARDQRLR